jgi:Tol biopolymer transport system component
MGMREPDISPDGLWIVFSANNNAAKLDIYLMRINGAEMTPLILDEANDFDPEWRPLP